MYNYATSTCTILDASTTECVYSAATSTPLFVQDAGNVTFILGWLVFFHAIIFMGFLFNITAKK